MEEIKNTSKTNDIQDKKSEELVDAIMEKILKIK